MTIDFSKFEDKIGIKFKNKDLLKQAFIHRSYINENPALDLWHNERLEYLGDAVLELVVTDHLFGKYPDKPEGDLTSFRSALVNSIMLSELASNLGMNDYLLLSKGETKDVGKARQYILANTFEAFVGALYLDRGYKKVEEFIAGVLFDRIDEVVSKRLWKDAKSLVQEKTQEIIGMTPNYNVLKEVGPDHDKQFTVGIFFGDEKIAQGSGRSKQEAEQEAAKKALNVKGWK